jgi:hypothetical protein
MCLYQNDVQTITGSLDGHPVVGTSQPDGTLIFATDAEPLALYLAKLDHDTLTVAKVVTEAPGPYAGTGPWRRLRR